MMKKTLNSIKRLFRRFGFVEFLTGRRRKRRHAFRLLVIESLDIRIPLAVDAQIVKDINAQAEMVGASPTNFVQVGSNVYFTSTTATTGSELWMSDGTLNGTVLVKDIWPGPVGSFPSYLTNVNGTLYFRANSATTGVELWKSDGTANGTVLVKDVRSGTASSYLNDLTGVNGTLFFRASNGTNGEELWKSDGTTAGTVMVKDIRVGSSPSYPRSLANVNGTLFFRATDGSIGSELWKSDGTASGTVLVKDIRSGSGNSQVSEIKELNGIAYFRADDGTNGYELWKSDGTSSGTVLVKNIQAGVGSGYPKAFTNINGVLYFRADDGIAGPELWKSDGTSAGTVLVRDIRSGSNGAFPVNLTNVNGTLYFSANDGSVGYELWKSDGSSSGTVLVKDIRSLTGSSPWDLVNLNGTLYFSANEGTNGVELWKSDGTASGTVLVKDINSGTASSNPGKLINVNGALFFQANNGLNGIELWKSDGTGPGTAMLKDLRTGTANASPSVPLDINGTLFFAASDGTNGNELWKSDGTSAGTMMIKDIYSGAGDSLPTEFANVNGTVYFRASTSTYGSELWKSDGTSAGTVMVKDIRPGIFGSGPSSFANVSGTLYFTAYDDTNGIELWKTDGTTAGTVLVKNIRSGNLNSSPTNLVNVNGSLYFRANDGTSGLEIWKSDGTSSGTVLLKDIRSGAAGSWNESSVGDLTNVNGTLYFRANDGTNGYELWKSDGTTAGTVLLKDILTGSGSSGPSGFTIVGNTLFFSASDATNGLELWKTDGTSTGTVLVKNIQSGSSWSSPSQLTNVNGTLFFRANEGINGYELWKSDGTSSGTVLVKDIQQGSYTSSPRYLVNTNGTLYFRANDGTSGDMLWKSDGTASGTVSLASSVAGSSVFQPNNLFASGNRLYYTVDTDSYGVELWRIKETNRTDITLSASSVAENAGDNAAIGVFSTLESSAEDSFTYALVPGVGDSDNALFNISQSTLRASSSFNFESKSNYTIRIRSTDQNGLSIEKQFGIAVDNVNEPPTAIAISSTAIAENSASNTSVGLLSTTDPDSGNTFSYALVAGAGDSDNGAFNITANNLRATSAFDFESKSTYTVRIRSTDQGGLSTDQVFTISVTNVNESPTDIGISSGSIPENSGADFIVGSFSTTDPDSNNTFAYTLVSGTGDTNNSAFNISAGKLRANSSFDFETKADYTVRVRSTDQGGLYTEKSFSVGVTNVNEAPTNISLTKTYIYNNVATDTQVAQIVVADPDTADTVFQLELISGTGDTHNGIFSLDADRLVIRNTSGLNAGSTLSIRLRATDPQGLQFVKVLPIEVRQPSFTNITLDKLSIAENSSSGSSVGVFGAVGADVNLVQFTLTSASADNSYFTIQGKTLKTAAAFDAESKAYYQIEVRASFEDMIVVKRFTVFVDPVNEFAPVLKSATSLAVDEGQRVVGTLSITDADYLPGSVTFLRTGSDANLFEIVDRQLRFKNAPDFEFPTDSNQDNLYTFSLQVLEGTLSNTYEIQVAVANTNDVPNSLVLSSSSFPNLAIPEDLAVGSTIGSFSVTDSDGPGAPSFRLINGGAATDNSSFQIIGNSLRSVRAFDYEDPSDRDLVIQVVAIDGLGATSAPTRIPLTVSDRAEAPVPGFQRATLDRNTFKDITLSATGNSNPISYTITQSPQHGILSGTLPNIRYTPTTNFVGQDIFYFTATQDGLTSREAYVELNVIGAKPNITLSGTGTFNEGTQKIAVVATLDQPADIDLSLTLEPISVSTASYGRDYSVPLRIITVPKGQTTTTFYVNIAADRNYEGEESATLRLIPSNLFNSNTTATITIVDDDSPPEIGMGIIPVRILESGSPLIVPLRLNATSYLPIVVPFTISGTATTGVDFVAPSAYSVTFEPGKDEASITLPMINDSIFESTETVEVVFGTPSLGGFANRASNPKVTTNIQDDDSAYVTLQTNPIRVEEGVGSFEIVATLDHSLASQTIVPLSVTGTATRLGLEADYLISGNAEFVFPAGIIKSTLIVSVLDDSVVENVDETIDIALTPSATNAYQLGDRRNGSFSIRDNDFAVASFEKTSLSVWEDRGSVTLRVKLDRALDKDVTLDLIASKSAPGWASSSDYGLSSSVISIPAGQLTGEVTLNINNDKINESTEELQISLGIPAGNNNLKLNKDSSARIQIQDNDPLIQGVSATNKYVMEDNRSVAEFVIALSAPTNIPTQIPFVIGGTATKGLDYIAPSTNQVTIAAGQIIAKVQIPLVQDTKFEGYESIVMSIQNTTPYDFSALATKTAEVNIIDDDKATVGFMISGQSVSEQPLSTFPWVKERSTSVTIQLSNPLPRDTSIGLAFSGRGAEDFYHGQPQKVVSNRVTIPAGSLSASFNLVIKHDKYVEGNEDLVVTITDATNPTLLAIGSQRTHVVTIIDDDVNRSTVTQVKPTSTSAVVNAGSLALPSVNRAPSSGTLNLPVVNTTSKSSGVMYSSGALAFSARGGVLDGATAFFDANFNGVMDQVNQTIEGEVTLIDEPSDQTSADGSFALDLGDFDSNSDGTIDSSEGRLVVTGGVDLSTGLPLQVPMAAPVGVYKIDPISTIAESLIRINNFSLADAFSRVAEGLEASNFDFINKNALYDTLNGDIAASIAYERLIEVYTALVSLSQYLSGLSNRTLATVSQDLVDSMASAISSNDAVVDLANIGSLRTIFTEAAVKQVISYNESEATTVLSVIAEGIQRLRAITLSGSTDEQTEQFLLNLYKTKKVLQGDMSNAIYHVGNGTRSAESLVADFTGTALSTRISQASSEVTVPPVVAVGTASVVEGDTGTKMLRFAIVKKGSHSYPISVDYSTFDDTATQGNDYQAVTGTLNWAANDTGTTQYVDVPILSDTGFESDETFFLRLANPTRLAIRSSEGFGFIINEDTTVVDASTDNTPVDITVESSLEQFSFLKNNDTLISGEFASPISLTYEGSINSADTVRYTTVGNALRPDKVRFDGGETNAVNDAFVLEGGIYRAIEMTFRTGESGLVRLAAPGAINYPELELNEFEQVVLGSAQVETVVLRVPVSYQSVTLSDVEGDPTLFQCALGGANGIANLRFSRPSGKVVVMGLDGSVTVSNQASGLTTETQRPGLYLEATAIDELEVAPNLGPMRSNEIGFESNVAYSIVPIDNAIGDFEIVNGNELKFKGSVDYETTPLLRTKVRAMSQAGAMLEAIVEIAVNNVNESPTNITISSQSLRENLGANAVVGSLSTTDPDAADSFVYSLVSGSGDTDNSYFNIHNGSIRAASNLDYEAKSSYSIRVQTQDQKGLTYAKAFSILVTNAPELVSVSVNGGDVFANSNQRSQITSLVVTTDLPLVDPTVAFTLTNIGLFTSSSSILSSSQILVSTVGNVYTLRFGSGAGVETRLGSSTRSNSLSDGNWVLSVAADQVTGSNQFGTQAVDRFFRMFGDSDGDGDVDGVDSFALRRAQLTASYNPALDWDGNGSVTSGVDLTNFSLNMNKRRRLF